MNSLVARFSLLFALAFLLTLPLSGQNTGSIQGIVVDPSGAVIPGASVQAVDQTKGIVAADTKTDPDGRFQLQPLQPGTYTVSVHAANMKQLSKRDITLDPRQVLGLGTLGMSVGATTESITVESRVPLVETANSDRSSVIDAQQVTETSLNGRDFQSLVNTLPGVVTMQTDSAFRLAFNNTDAFHINGMRGSANNVYLDGAINTDVGANDGQFTQLSMDAVGEFKVQTSNFAAEYGRNPGVLLAINTKSGGQRYHGTLYEFNREDGFDANSFFNKNDPNTGLRRATPIPKSKLRFNQFGGNIGGPIPLPHSNTKKLFFFYNYEGTRALRPNGGQTYTAPNPAFLNGDFSSFLKSDFIPTAPAFHLGQIFIPGTITRNPQGNITGGTPYPGNIIPTSQFSAQYAAWKRLLTRAYLPGAAANPNDPSQFTVPFQDTYHFNKNQHALRIDFTINPKTNFFFRWVDDSQREGQGFGIFSGNSFPILPQFRKKPGSSWSWNLVNVIAPTLTNEFIFSYNHLTQVVDIDQSVPKANYDKTQLGFTYQDIFQNANIRNIFPNFSAGISAGFFPPGWQSEARMFTWTDNVTKTLGPHTFKTGVFVDYNQAGQQPSWTESPRLDFTGGQDHLLDTNNGLANLLLGNYKVVSQSNGVFFGAFRFHQTEAFGQDSWKVSRKLTLDYGLRWAYIGPTFTVKPFFQNYWDPTRYDPAQAVTIDITNSFRPLRGSIVSGSGNPFNGIIQEGQGIPEGFVKHRYNNFAPRLGFAYDPWGNGRTAIRGGFGVFYERIRQNVNSFDALGNPPLSFTPNIYNGNLDSLSPGLVSSGARFPVDIRAVNKEGQIPTTYSWSLGIQRELPWQLGSEIAYVGNTTRHLQYIVNLNQLAVGTTTSTPILTNANNVSNAVRPFKGYQSIIFTNYGANSSYNALQTRLSRRFSRGLSLSADYTWSKTIDLVDNDDATNGLPDTYHPKTEYGPAGYDRTHVFNVNYVYTLPEWYKTGALRWLVDGWELSGITRFWSGPPFSVFANGSNPGTLGSNSGTAKTRANFSGGNVYVPGHAALQWFDPTQFTVPLNGTLGNTGRNAFRGPGINNWDISIFKNFNFTESKRLQLRLETFNTFNHTQFIFSPGSGNASISAPGPGLAPTTGPSGTAGNAGKITGARDPRNVQLGAKLYF